jgi:hypothetical protein
MSFLFLKEQIKDIIIKIDAYGLPFHDRVHGRATSHFGQVRYREVALRSTLTKHLF